MKFDFEKSTSLAVKYDNNFYVSGSTLLDFSAIKYKTRIEHFKHKGETDWGNVNLGTIKFSRSLQVEDHVNAVNIQGKITDVLEKDTKDGYMYVYSENMRFYRNAHVNV